MVASSTASAGSPALQQLVDDIRGTCKDMNQGSDTWKDCEDKQSKLATFANCSTKMFGPKDSSGKRSFTESVLDDCQKKINNKREVPRRAQEKLDHIIDKCKDIDRADGALPEAIADGEWNSCESSQNTLKIIGCSGNMFEKVGGGFGEEKWSYVQSEIDACQQIINQIKTSPDTKPGEGADPADASGASAGDNIPCRGGPMGWVMCPLIEVMSEALQTIAGFIDGMMQFRLLSQTNSQDALRDVWQTFLNIANVFLVIAFLIIIFSQTTSAGLSNYGIKRMLPRLVMAAILMNISFYICAFAIDMSNILGSSVMGLFTNMTDIANWNYTNSDGVVKDAFADKSGADGLGTGFVTYLSAGIAAVVIILFFLVPVVLSALLVFVVLVARQVILTILVIVAPLAFVAWLLPNTEQYFKKWWQLFSQMLFAYPMVMAVFGAAIFVAELIQGVNQVNSKVDAAEIGGPGVISAIVPLVVLAIPLFVIPKLIMSTNSIMGKVGAAMQKGYGATGLSGLGTKQRKAAWGITGKPAANRAGYEVKRSRPGRFFRNQAARGKNTDKRRQEEFAREEAGAVAEHELRATDGQTTPEAQRRRATAQATLDHLNDEAIKQQVISLKSQATQAPGDSRDILQAELTSAAASGDHIRAAAAIRALGTSGGGGVDRASDAIESIEASGDMTPELKGALSQELSGNSSFKDAQPALGSWAGGGSGSLQGDIAGAGPWENLSGDDVAKLTSTSITKGGAHLSEEAIKAALHPESVGKLGKDKSDALKTVARSRNIPIP